jgi:hypothetical protein
MECRFQASRVFLAVLTGLVLTAPVWAVAPGQIDEFENGTTMGWAEGPPSPNPPRAVADGGPGGPGDGYLENEASGTSGPGGRLVMFNQDQWKGDYLAAGLTGIEAWAANLGQTTLHLRVALIGPAGAAGSTGAVRLPPDGQWRPLSFALSASGLTSIFGGVPVDDVLADVTELRILSAEGVPTTLGDVVAGRLAIDDIRAVGDAAVACAVDNDCDDGVFCNGLESCECEDGADRPDSGPIDSPSGGRPRPGGRPVPGCSCVASEPSCHPGEVCDEALDECVHEGADLDIVAFRAPRWVRGSEGGRDEGRRAGSLVRTRQIDVLVENRSGGSFGTATARLESMNQAGLRAIQELQVSDAAGGRAGRYAFRFPDELGLGAVTHRLTLVDGNADVDEALAQTMVTP